jgi:DNA-binding XRE family transcriptional regulator
MSVMKELQSEIARLARKEIKKELEPVKRVNAAQRGLIANLRRDLAALQKEVNQLRKAVPEEAIPVVEDDGRQGFWITGKGIASLRKRLGLTQAELASLAEVSTQSVVKWEKIEGKIPFRQEKTAAKMKLIRSMGKTDAREALGA